MKKIGTKQIIVITVAAVIGGILGSLGVNYFFNSSSGNAFDKQLIQAAGELNKNCPFMVNKYTRLDNAIVLPDKVFQYNYTLVNFSKDEIDIDQLRNAMQPFLLYSIKMSKDLKFFRDNKVTIKYSYNDKNAVFLFALECTYDDYK